VNLFDSLCDTGTVECLDILLTRPRIRIERIVSFGQANPPGFWYDQEEGECVGARWRRAIALCR
jgi:cupin 2 domain-containing protein